MGISRNLPQLQTGIRHEPVYIIRVNRPVSVKVVKTVIFIFPGFMYNNGVLSQQYRIMNAAECTAG